MNSNFQSSPMAMASSSSNSQKSFPILPLPSLSSLTSTLLSRVPFLPKPVQSLPPLEAPVQEACSSLVTVPFLLPDSKFSTGRPTQARSVLPGVRIEGLSSTSSNGVGSGPAFVGHVYTMLDPSGNGLMAVARHLRLPFLTERTPDWFKKMITFVTKSDINGPVFRFFMDLTDAVSYVKKLNVPAGMVGACRLDVAHKHFRENPNLFQFVPNEKQVKEANKLLKSIPQSQNGRRKKLKGVPVFTAQNLNIAIATSNGLKWYTPYFFDKGMLDKILEASIDQHFGTMIQNRHIQRRNNNSVIDDSLPAEIGEDNNDSFDPPEVKELMDEMVDEMVQTGSGIPLNELMHEWVDEIVHTGKPFSKISKAAEIGMLDVADKVFLGNKWFRKASGIQPKFPYLVDSFEERSAASFNKAGSASTSSNNFQIDTESNTKLENHDSHLKAREEIMRNPLLPKITMVGISMGEGNNAQVNKTSIKKTMEDLTKELDKSYDDKIIDENDPLFFANVVDYFTRIPPFSPS